MTAPTNTPPNDRDETPRPWWSRVGPFLASWLWRRWRSELTAPPEREEEAAASVDRGHEGETVDVSGVVVFGIGLLVLIGGTMLVLVGLLRWFRGEELPPPPPFARVEQVPPEPRLQPAPAVDLTQWQRRVTERLDSYGWIDRSQGIVHLPIDRAIALVAEEGLPHDTTNRVGALRRIISSSGFAWEPVGPPPPGPPPYLGTSPEPYVPDPDVLRALPAPDSVMLDRDVPGPEQP